jgi:hypothetical protein
MINLIDLYAQNPLKACQLALRRTANLPWKNRLEKINDLLGCYGTEAIRGEWQNGYWCDIVASYVNTGDTYNLTVLHIRGDNWNPAGEFIISSWGDWVEKNQRKYSIQ